MDISHGYVAWISRDMSGYLLDISSGYRFLDISEIYPILPKDIQEISFHILSYPFISNNIQRYPTISRDIQMGRTPRWATRLGKRKDARDTAAAAAVTASTSDRRGTLVAVGLSLLWAAFSPGAIAMVARGIKHSWSPARVCALNETSSTGWPRNLVSER